MRESINASMAPLVEWLSTQFFCAHSSRLGHVFSPVHGNQAVEVKRAQLVKSFVRTRLPFEIGSYLSTCECC